MLWLLMIFFHMGDSKEAYNVLQAGVLLEILPPLTRCHTGPPSPCYHITVEYHLNSTLHLGVLLRILSAFS